MRVPFWLRVSIAGLAGGVAWFLGLLILFGPAQRVLTDPALQSSKMLSVFAPGDHQPKAYDAPHLVIVGLLVIGVAWGWMYGSIRTALGRGWWRRGLRFGLGAWIMMALWFEFYLPWNVLHEPASLVALELVLWLGVMLLVGLSIAAIDKVLKRSGNAA